MMAGSSNEGNVVTVVETTEDVSEIRHMYYLNWPDHCDNVPNHKLCHFPVEQRAMKKQEGGESTMKCGVWLKQALTINRVLLPLKLTLFFFSASAFSILPYLTIHMKDMGISVEHIALMYAILPFTIFLAPPTVGYLADKMGSYTRVLILTVVGSAVFHTILYFLPHISVVSDNPAGTSFSLEGNSALFTWGPCLEGLEFGLKCPEDHFDKFNLELDQCQLDCLIDVRTCEAVTAMFVCQQEGEEGQVQFNNVSLAEANSTDCHRQLEVHIMALSRPLEMAPGCRLDCQVSNATMDHLGAKCQATQGNRTLTNVLYFIFRMLATMCLACNFVLLHTQTIQMCKVEEAEGRSGSLGRQYVFEALAQAVISPSVGKLMDFVSQTTDGKPNYLVPFLALDVFLALTVVMIMCIKLNLNLPKSSGVKGLKLIFSNLDICFFLGVMFVLGNCFGFVETFLFLYLKDEMGAPMYLLGLTITTGAVISIPFLYVSDWIVNKVGKENVFITALFMYAIRYVGYSYITNPWMSFPFEALELFTLQLMKVATSQYAGQRAPKGLLATLNGMAGGMHYGFGKGTGGLIGGAIIAATGSIAIAFRYFGVASAVCGLIYFSYEYCYAGGFAHYYRNIKKDHEVVDDTKEDFIKEPFLDAKKQDIPIVRPNTKVSSEA